MKSMKCLWAGVSGIIEKNDTTPLARAKTEILEETGIGEGEIKLLKANERIKIEEIIDYIKSSQEKISKNVDLEKSYKKLSTMIKTIEK